ncbi:hypothetical protein SETIT_3G302700v2 [Setaria italica]|uniref:Uncharacterized protein n=1 Tax=Setaria italica TaxID=4555 RepID=A0A368QKP9_SETIT|nr:hypothetical protein SETIT_3G302700v2 [Setaria italica]
MAARRRGKRGRGAGRAGARTSRVLARRGTHIGRGGGRRRRKGAWGIQRRRREGRGGEGACGVWCFGDVKRKRRGRKLGGGGGALTQHGRSRARRVTAEVCWADLVDRGRGLPP